MKTSFAASVRREQGETDPQRAAGDDQQGLCRRLAERAGQRGGAGDEADQPLGPAGAHPGSGCCRDRQPGAACSLSGKKKQC